MRLTDLVPSLASVAFLGTTVSAFGRHAAHEGLLQIPPAFAKDGVVMYPALHPEHDHTDLHHLVPEITKSMHYSQEGHRPALHGSKHAHMEAIFSHHTVILDHSSHIEDVSCTSDHIKVCFKTPEARDTVKKSWKEISSDEFNLATYHINCGHLHGESRSFFRASKPTWQDDCVTVSTTFLDEKEALHGGELSWGTYTSPHLVKRERVKGHARVSKPEQIVMDGSGGDEVVDLTKNASALHEFFGPVVQVDTDVPDSGTQGGGFMDYEGDLVKRGLFSWLVDAFEALIGLIRTSIEVQIAVIKVCASVMIQYAATAVKLLLVPFGVPFDQEYHVDFPFKFYIPSAFAIGTSIEAAVAKGLSEIEVINRVADLIYAKQGGSIAVNCAHCGTQGHFQFEGKLAFSIATGLSKAQISLINAEPFVIEAVFGITPQGRALPEGHDVPGPDGKKSKKGFRTTASAPIKPIPLGPWSIPTLLTIGPQLVVEPQISAYVDSKVNIEVGPRFTVSTGNVTFDALNPDNNVAYGWEPKFEWVFDANGNIVATGDMALQVGIEMALDVLSSTFKLSAGIYTAPSAYFTAEYSNGQGKKCDNGVELRIGAKNRVYAQLLDKAFEQKGKREFEFPELTSVFADKGLGCLSSDGWDPDKVEEFQLLKGGVFNTHLGREVSSFFNDMLATDQNRTVTDPDRIETGVKYAHAVKQKNEKGEVRKMPETHGFRVIQDSELKTTLVSGTDGFIYATDSQYDHDISAPWGSIDVTKEQFNYDVFGRVLHFNASRLREDPDINMVELGVSPSEKMPKGLEAASFKAIKTENGTETFAIALNTTRLHPDEAVKEWVWYPTVCQIPHSGLQLYATRYLVTEEGSARTVENAGNAHWIDAGVLIDAWESNREYRSDFDKLGLKHLTKKGRKRHGKKHQFEFDGEGEAKSRGRAGAKKQHKQQKQHGKKVKVEKDRYKRCRTVRLISDLKNRGNGSLVSNAVQDVANVGDAAVGAATGAN